MNVNPVDDFEKYLWKDVLMELLRQKTEVSEAVNAADLAIVRLRGKDED